MKKVMILFVMLFSISAYSAFAGFGGGGVSFGVGVGVGKSYKLIFENNTDFDITIKMEDKFKDIEVVKDVRALSVREFIPRKSYLFMYVGGKGPVVRISSRSWNKEVEFMIEGSEYIVERTLRTSEGRIKLIVDSFWNDDIGWVIIISDRMERSMPQEVKEEVVDPVVEGVKRRSSDTVEAVGDFFSY